MKFIIELLFLVYGLFLLQQAQYLTLLILLILSLILVLKGFKYNHGVIISITILLFLTQFHRYYPYRDTSNNFEFFENENDENENDENENEDTDKNNIEGFKVQDKEIIKMKKEARKKRKERKKMEKRLKEEYKKANSHMPRRYIKNVNKINKKTNTWGEGLNKWKYLKENFYIIMNM